MENKFIIDRLRKALASQIKSKLIKLDYRCVVKINQYCSRLIVVFPSDRTYFFNIDIFFCSDEVIFFGLTLI